MKTMAKRIKARADLEGLLASLSETMFPDRFGSARIALDTRAADGDTPLHVVVRQCNLHGTRLLIEAGADLNASGNQGETPLHAAVFEQNEELVRLLLAAGANTAAQNKRHQTPIVMARDIAPQLVRLFQ